jgi:DNA-binding response OmpR family regulator
MRALLAEDDPRIAAAVRAKLEEAGFAIDVARDGEAAWFAGDTEPYDAIVLDLGLPKIDGLEVLRRWREGGLRTPILVLTARGAWTERVAGIDAGADDYLPKPFQMDELVARLRALIRRSVGEAAPVLRAGPVSLDPRRMEVTADGRAVALSPLEFRLLAYLMHHRGRVATQIELTEHLYAQDVERDSNAVEVAVGRLRRKLGVGLIETRRGFGYIIPEGE